MAYVPIPKDLTAVKTKVLFNLTKRQLLCFGGGALVGVPLFFLVRSHMNTSAAAICMIIVMLPFFLLAMCEKNGQPLEKAVWNMIRVCFLRPKQRKYKTNNFYAVLERQDSLDREVLRIVNKTAHKSREKANRSGHCAGKGRR
ncbi:MAG: PrgI family protein [Oscillospiraceae bacterium]|nr:PrgI family protein [Oscillospiraceae bacterium]